MCRAIAVFLVASILCTGAGFADWRVSSTNELFSSTQYITMTGTSEANRALILGCRRDGDLFIAYTEPSPASSIPATGSVKLFIKAGKKDIYNLTAQTYAPAPGLVGLRTFDKQPLVEFLKDVRDAHDVVSIGFEIPNHTSRYDVSAKGSTKAANALLDQCEL